jgi:hypothetical protein
MLTVDSVAQYAFKFMVDVSIKERKMAVSFRIHSQLDVLMDTGQVVKEVN